MILILDTLAMLFRSYHAIPDLKSSDGIPTGAIYGLTNSLLKTIQELKPEHCIACYDSPEQTLRQKMHSEYKANREAPEEEFVDQINISKQLLRNLGVHTIESPGHEADDLIGSLVSKIDEEIVILTCDGDLLQLTVKKNTRVFLLRKGISDMVLLDEEGVEKKNGYPANRIIEFKGLAGDASDNISGVRGIGETYAKRLIGEFGDLENVFKAIEEGVFLQKQFTPRIENLLKEGKEAAFLSRDLATIHTDINIQIPYSDSKKWIDLAKDRFEEGQEILSRYSLYTPLKKYKNLLGEVEVKKTNLVVEDKELFKKTSIALWISDSDLTNADADKILSYTKTNSLEDALTKLENGFKATSKNFIWEEMEKPLIEILEKIECAGIKIDLESLNKLSAEFHLKIDNLQKEIYKLTEKEFNINSPKQLGEILFKDLDLKPPTTSKTSTGKKSTKEAVLLSMLELHPIIQLVLDYRHYKKLTSTYLDVFPNLLDKENRIHTTFIQNGTTTGRLASKEPNLQNIPIKGEDGTKIRNLFISEKGWNLISIDYSQMELRLAAILSKDETFLNVFKEGQDIHQSVAAQMFNIGVEEVTKDQRNSAKAVNFGILYGMGAQALKKSLDVSLQDAKIYLEDYKKAFPGLINYLEEKKKEARDTGKVSTAFGRERNIPEIHSSLPFIRAQAERFSINAPIQGTSADIIKLSMISIDKKLKEVGLEKDVRMILQIHDELLVEVKEGVEEKAVKILKESMEGIYPENQKPIALITEARVGDKWGSLKVVN